MFDIYATKNPVSNRDIRKPEFFRIELAPLQDGGILASLTATTLDEDEPQLLDQEIACERVATIEDVFVLINTHVRVVPDAGSRAHVLA